MAYPDLTKSEAPALINWHFPVLFLLIAMAACSSAPTRNTASFGSGSFGYEDKIELLDELLDAESQSTEPGRKILATGRKMTLEQQEIVRGSCWDYANAVYDRTGYPNSKTSRQTVFKGTKSKGPYADAGLIRPGDWLYYINHSYNDVEHSAIFVKWLDETKRIGLMLSYGGEKRREPARYLPYDLTHVYQIMRPAEPDGEQLVSAR